MPDKCADSSRVNRAFACAWSIPIRKGWSDTGERLLKRMGRTCVGGWHRSAHYVCCVGYDNGFYAISSDLCVRSEVGLR